VTHPEGDSRAPRAPTRAEALRYWFRLGCLSFGGPAGQIALMHRELVDEKRWISERRFLHALNYCMVLPGPEAQQLATYIGWLMHRTWGGIVSGGLFVLPSLVVLIALSWLYMAYGNVPAVAGILYGVKPAVVAIVLHAAWRMGSRTLRHPALWVIAAMAFVAIAALAVPFPAIVLAAGLAGYVGGRVAPAAFATSSVHAADGRPHAASIIDDDTPTPAHARFAWRRLVTVLLAFFALWGTALLALAALAGRDSPLVLMGWFFTKAALLTFGGAYAVLPYVYQGAVGAFGWVTPVQMIDGLALGETTPGPLIMVVAFVGFVGGWTKQLFGPDLLPAAGIAAACVVTFFTFLPSFMFILAGGPLIETTHGQLKFTAPLKGITAAVVGVIVNLAGFFAWHVFWPGGWRGGAALAGLDPVALAIAAAAALALFRYKAGVIPVILACGAAGLVAALTR
jgi:chromate transporter